MRKKRVRADLIYGRGTGNRDVEEKIVRNVPSLVLEAHDVGEKSGFAWVDAERGFDVRPSPSALKKIWRVFAGYTHRVG